MTPYIIAGIVTGCIYAISALGLVLTYTSSRVFNFAAGAIAYSVAVFYYWLHEYPDGPRWSIAVAAPVAILVAAPLLGLVLYGLLFKRLTNATPTVRLVSTVGLWVALPAIVKIIFTFVNEGEIFQPDGLVNNPPDPEFLKVLGTNVNSNQFVVIMSAAAIALVTTLVLKFTPLGLATRASVDHPRNAGIAGINTEGVTAISWMVGTMLAGFAGVLFAPVVSLAEFQYTLLLVGSFVAVVIGRMTSLPLAFVGAIGVGILQQVWVKYQPENGFFAHGVSASIPFMVMLVFLIVYSFTSSGLRREAFAMDARAAGGAHGDAPPLPPSRGWRRVAGPVVLLAGLAVVPLVFDGYWTNIFTVGVALSIIFLSFTLVTGEGGIISLAQITFAGIGAFAAARLADSADVFNVGMPVWAAIIVGALIAVPFGLALALPSLRIGDLYLALLTVGFALLIQEFVWKRVEFENFGAGRILGRPFGLGLDDRVAMYYVVVAVFLVCALLIVNVKRATAGLVFASIRSSEAAAVTTGISVVRAKMILFAVSAFVAGLGGALWGSTVGSVTPRSFDVLVGVVWLAIIVTWGVRTVIGALLAGLLFAIAPFKLAVILILVLVFLTGGFFTRLLLSKAYRKPAGAIAMALLVVVGASLSYRMWTKTSDDTAVHVILVVLALVIGLVLGLRMLRLTSVQRPAKITLAVAFGVFGVALAVWTIGLDLSEQTVKEVPTMLFGLGAIGLAREPRGVLYDMVNRQRLRQLEETERREEQGAVDAELAGGAVSAASAATGSPTAAAAETGPALLAAEGVTVRFGGVVALDNVRIEVPPGATVGLVGPNGAGKTTLFGVLSGLLRPKAGRVMMSGADITGRSPQARARLGLARTFQRMELFTELTVREHLVLAQRVREGRQSVLGFARDLSGFGERPGKQEREMVDEILDLLALTSVADRPAVSVPLGTGRLIEVARALASEPTVMLLDEPSSGLDVHETEQLGEALRRVRIERGTSFVLVEHNVEFVLELSDRVTVLDFGKVLVEGTPDEIRRSPEVQAAYFGASVGDTSGGPEDAGTEEAQ